jgi:hypothetical protein
MMVIKILPDINSAKNVKAIHKTGGVVYAPVQSIYVLVAFAS